MTPSCECTCHIHFGKEAADEIVRLRARVNELKLDIEASDADRHFHEDFYTPPEDEV